MDHFARDWMRVVGNFVGRNIPRDCDGDWDHSFTSAFQMGCELLDALGLAAETGSGATPSSAPQLPPIPPRWDDTCVTILKLCEQSGQLCFPNEVAARGQIVTHRLGEFSSQSAPPNIASGSGTGPAFAAPQALRTLQSLGLVAAERWTDAAETILWRNWPNAWAIRFLDDPRFLAAVNVAVVTMPRDIRDEILGLVNVADVEVLAAARRTGRSLPAMRAALVQVRRHSLDWVFFRSWRLGDGWLTEPCRARPLDIFHDDLAIALRAAVVERITQQK